MTQIEFFSLLNSVDFPRRYWELCDRYPLRPDEIGRAGKKDDVLAAFARAGVAPRYDPRDRSFRVEDEQIGDMVWSGLFVKQRSGGLELMISAVSASAKLGSNFARLAYEPKFLVDPSFTRSPFTGPPPYPRPAHNGDAAALAGIVTEFVALVRLIKDAVRRQTAAG
jgi:hypothetical protein